jgi:small-conductance mechanosensitive channel
MSVVDRLSHFFTEDRLTELASASFILVLTLVVARVAGRSVRHLIAARGDPQRAILAGRLTTWTALVIGLGMSLDELGFKLRVLLGAAGVLSVAVGFASQTTLSNLISGFFLFGERPFRLGDTVEIDTIVGEVLSIDMMSTTLRTMDNRFVRIPNELVIKTKVTNHTRFPLRRLELTVPVAANVDFAALKAALLDLADKNALVLVEPAPSVFIGAFADNTLQVQLWLWTRTKNLQDLKARFTADMHRQLVDSKARPVPAPK